MPKSVLAISNLTIAFQYRAEKHIVLQDFHLNLQRGLCVGLVGESGSGKTISALSILQLLPNNARVNQNSRIIYREKNLLDLSEKEMRCVRGKYISMIFQDAMSAFNPVLTIGHQLSETIRLHLLLTSRDAKKRALTLLESVGIQDSLRCYQSYPHELSGGMRQRAMIAMAISVEPEIIIADEPTTALDVVIQQQIIELLLQFKQKNSTLLFIGHDLSVISQIADEVTVLKQGRVIEQNNAKQFFEKPKEQYSQELLEAILPQEKRQKNNHDHEKIILTVDHLKLYFPIRAGFLRRVKNYVKAVDDVSFDIRAGETVALMGESGSGKTTLAKSILQLLKNTDGKVIFQNNVLSELSSKALRRMRSDMQIIFQDPYSALNPRMLLMDSLCEGLLVQKKARNKKEALSIVDLALENVELSEDFIWRYPHELSGGQRQRICIARALTLSPALLILDEPTSALDVSTQKQILLLLEKLQKEKNMAYLLITHNMSVVNFLAHRVLQMKQGKIMSVEVAAM